MPLAKKPEPGSHHFPGFLPLHLWLLPGVAGRWASWTPGPSLPSLFGVAPTPAFAPVGLQQLLEESVCSFEEKGVIKVERINGGGTDTHPCIKNIAPAFIAFCINPAADTYLYPGQELPPLVFLPKLKSAASLWVSQETSGGIFFSYKWDFSS